MKRLIAIIAVLMIAANLLAQDAVKGKYKVLEQVPDTTLKAGETLITGRVMDFAGRPIAASVTLDGTDYAQFVDSAGKYRMIVPAGKYKIRAEYTGCNPLTTSKTDFKPQQKTVVNILLGTSLIEF